MGPNTASGQSAHPKDTRTSQGYCKEEFKPKENAERCCKIFAFLCCDHSQSQTPQLFNCGQFSHASSCKHWKVKRGCRVLSQSPDPEDAFNIVNESELPVRPNAFKNIAKWTHWHTHTSIQLFIYAHVHMYLMCMHRSSQYQDFLALILWHAVRHRMDIATYRHMRIRFNKIQSERFFTAVLPEIA